MATLNVKTLKNYIAADLNVIISGVHGVGKTAKLQEACAQLGLSMKYYSASTLDPYTDLTGVPVPNKETRTVEYYRPREIDAAEVIFFDEINRADPKTINAIFEITQFGTINGEKLPNLRCVVAAMNPVSDEYTTDELDQAFLDRFDIFLQANPEIDTGYFVTKFGDRLGAAATTLWNEYEASRNSGGQSTRNRIPYISPRRMDKIVAAFKAIPTRQTIRDALPPEITDQSILNLWHRGLSEALKEPAKPTDAASAAVVDIINSSVANQRSVVTGRRVTDLINEGKLTNEDKAKLFTSLASALNEGKSVKTIVSVFGAAVRLMNATQIATLTAGWDPRRTAELQRELAA